NCSRPSAVARRRAGSTVTTRTLPPRCTAAMAAAAAAVVVLPTPPEPQEITISLVASNCSRVRTLSSPSVFLDDFDVLAGFRLGSLVPAATATAPRPASRPPDGWHGLRGYD